jgi:drug/metabolite transporter (DMT)-like permease
MASTESIAVELFYVVLYIPTLVIAAIAVPIAGIALLFIHRIIMNDKVTILREWRYLIIISVLFAITEFTWYDAVSHIGAGKTSLINLPLETLSIVILAWLFLNERLNSIQIIGASIVIVGIILSIGSDVTSTNITQFGIGEIESIIASLSGAVQAILIVKLLFKYKTLEVTAFTLIISGVMLQFQWFFNPFSTIQSSAWFYVLLSPLVPMALFFLQYLSMNKIGASFTSIIGSVSIVLTVTIQLILVRFAVPVTIPENVTLALTGGAVSVLGICFIFMNIGIPPMNWRSLYRKK